MTKIVKNQPNFKHVFNTILNFIGIKVFKKLK